MQRLHTVMLITLLVGTAIGDGTWIAYLVAQRANTALWIEDRNETLAHRQRVEQALKERSCGAD